MPEMSRDNWKQFVAQWRASGPALDRIRATELRNYEHDPATVDSLLRIGDRLPRPRTTSGLVQLQRWLARLADLQNGLPRAVHESRTDYDAPSDEESH